MQNISFVLFLRSWQAKSNVGKLEGERWINDIGADSDDRPVYVQFNDLSM